MKVLFFVDRMRVGGIQTLLVNIFRHLDYGMINCELLLLDDGEHYKLEDIVANMGVKVYKLNNVWLRKPHDYIKYRKAVDTFFSLHHDYQVIHMNSGPKNAYILKKAKEYKIPVRIAHSHNSNYQTKSIMQRLIGNIMKISLRKNANVYLACSDYAAKWMFGTDSRHAIILPNGIDLDDFEYNVRVRREIRAELGIEENAIVIGNVGRFTPQKNHERIVRIFSEFLKYKPDSYLVLAGIGELLEATKSLVLYYGIQDRVKFLGFRNDVKSLIQGMDLFLMPSLYEGFPVTAVEAQASGLPCIFSDTITRNVKIMDNVKYVSLNESDSTWISEMIESLSIFDRTESVYVLKEKGYDINDMINKLMLIYQSCG